MQKDPLPQEAAFRIRRATEKDVQELVGLCQRIYENQYPLRIGGELKATKDAVLDSEHFLLLVAEDTTKQQVVGCLNFQINTINQIALIQGLVIDPVMRKANLGSRLVQEGTELLFQDFEKVNSIYGTARSISLAPQKICLQAGFKPLGILPNMYKIDGVFENMVLLVKYRPSVLKKRLEGQLLPSSCCSLLHAANEVLQNSTKTHPLPLSIEPKERAQTVFSLHLEEEKSLVQRAFETYCHSHVKSMVSPVQLPNCYLEREGKKAFLHLNKQGGMGHLLGGELFDKDPQGAVEVVLNYLTEQEINYLDVFVRMSEVQLIELLRKRGFLATAFYPALIEVDKRFVDFVALCYTKEPLHFSQGSFVRPLEPFITNSLKQVVENELSSIDWTEVA